MFHLSFSQMEIVVFVGTASLWSFIWCSRGRAAWTGGLRLCGASTCLPPGFTPSLRQPLRVLSVWLFLSKIMASLRLVPEGLCPHPLSSVGQGPGQESRGWHLGQKGTQGRKLGDGGS